MVKFFKNVNGCFSPCEEEEAEYAMLVISEYNGLQNALRIVKDRAMQQIDKSTADNNGYRLLRANVRRYSHSIKDEFWMITKATPYSTKIPLDIAHEMIMRDLREYYHYYDFHDNLNHSGLPVFNISDLTLLQKACDLEYQDRFPESRHVQLYRNFIDEDKYCINNRLVMSFSFNHISSNYAQGVYEITYWATELI